VYFNYYELKSFTFGVDKIVRDKPEALLLKKTNSDLFAELERNTCQKLSFCSIA